MVDFCLMCGDEVDANEWRKHMIIKHSMVLSKSPITQDGKWKAYEDIKVIRVECSQGDLNGTQIKD